MKKSYLYHQKKRNIIIFCVAIIIASLNILVDYNVNNTDANKIEYKNVNIRNIAVAKVSVKKGLEDNEIVSGIEKITNLNLVNSKDNSSKVQAISLPVIEEKKSSTEQPKVVWRLPVENGTVTTWPSYWHPAFDITSWRGTDETIYPVADGTISSIYTDYAGAKIVTVHHYINNVNYTSLYAHLSSYANGIYVGMPVNTDTPLGQMGSTGISTGNHLHISLVDCSINDPNDGSCSNLGRFFNYLKVRHSQGFQGLKSVLDVPWTWSSR